MSARLRNAGRGERLLLEAVEDGLDGVAKCALDLRARLPVRVPRGILLQRRQDLTQILQQHMQGTLSASANLLGSTVLLQVLLDLKAHATS